VAQLLDHVVEGGRQLADFVARGDVDRSIEPAGFHRSRSFQQPPHRSGNAGADEEWKYQSEDACEQGEDNGDDNGSLLVAHRHHGIAADLRKHVGADSFDPLVEFVAQRVGAGQASPGLREITGIEQGQQPLVFFTQVAMKIAGHALDSIVDPAEPGVIGYGGWIINDRIDQGARRLCFPIQFLTLHLIDFSLIRNECLVRRRLHPADHHPACRQSLLQRMDIHPRQMSVRLDIFAAELIELMGNPAGHHRRQRRRDRHQEDQAEGDAENSLSDRRPQHGCLF
jgi:hypothetical protein